MNDDAAFLAAIVDAPGEDGPRLVYADWLDQRGRRGGDFLRIECELAGVDRAVDHWWVVFSRLRAANKDLDEGWIAAVSRVPVEELFAREREIQHWLRRRIAVAEVPSGALQWEKPTPPPKGLWRRIRRLFTRSPEPSEAPSIKAAPAWAAAHLRPGDELWEYATGPESWAHLCGEMGYAIVRNGKVVEFEMLMMN